MPVLRQYRDVPACFGPADMMQGTGREFADAP